MKKINKITLGLATVVMGLSGQAIAASETASVDVSASLLPTCKVSLSSAINLQYNPQNGATDSHFFNVICTKTTAYEIGINGGGSYSALNRLMKNGDNSLSYTVKNPDGDILGDIDGPHTTLNGIGTGSNVDWGIDIEIPGGQYVQLGTYTDVLVVTFNY